MLQVFRVIEFHRSAPTPVDYPVIPLLKDMYVMTKEYEIKYCYFTLEKVRRVHLEGGSYHIFMDIYNYFILFIFRLENIFHIIKRNIKKSNLSHL